MRTSLLGKKVDLYVLEEKTRKRNEMGNKRNVSEEKTAGEGLAAFVGVSAPETPKYILANNFLTDYFNIGGNTETVYNYDYFTRIGQLYCENLQKDEKLRYSFDTFIGRYAGNEVMHEENGKLNKSKHYYFPITPDMITTSNFTLRHILYMLQTLDKNFNYKQMQEMLEKYVFGDDTGINHIMKLLLDSSTTKEFKLNNAPVKNAENFWNMLTSTERTRMCKLSANMNEDMTVLLTHEYFRKLDFYRRYNYLSVLLTSYVIQYIICRRGSNVHMLCQGAPRDSRVTDSFHKASCNNYAYIRKLFAELLKNYYTKIIRDTLSEGQLLRIQVDYAEITVNGEEFNEFINRMFPNRKGKTTYIDRNDIIRAFSLQEEKGNDLLPEDFAMRYIELTGSQKGANLTKISSILPTCGRQIEMIFPQNRARQKYFAMSETLAEFYIRLYLARKKIRYDYLDNFIEDLQSRYKIIIVKNLSGERALKAMKINLKAQEYSNNKKAFVDMLNSINCLIKLSDSGYVVTLPEEKGAFKLI